MLSKEENTGIKEVLKELTIRTQKLAGKYCPHSQFFGHFEEQVLYHIRHAIDFNTDQEGRYENADLHVAQHVKQVCSRLRQRCEKDKSHPDLVAALQSFVVLLNEATQEGRDCSRFASAAGSKEAIGLLADEMIARAQIVPEVGVGQGSAWARS